MPIEIKGGFLMLTAVRGSNSEFKIFEAVKGSQISRITKGSLGTLVTVGGSGWSVEVMDEPGDILEAITSSYKQVTR